MVDIFRKKKKPATNSNFPFHVVCRAGRALITFWYVDHVKIEDSFINYDYHFLFRLDSERVEFQGKSSSTKYE